MSYFLSGWSSISDSPFVVDCSPILPSMYFVCYFWIVILIDNEVTPYKAASKIIKRCNFINKPVLIMDAAFGSLKLIHLCQEEKIPAILSVNTGVQNKLFWEWMSYDLGMKL
jgi:hypothetical protein